MTTSTPPVPRRLAAVLGATAVAVAGALALVPATAAPTVAGRDGTTTVPAVVSRVLGDSRGALLDYWTPARMRAATPLDLTPADSGRGRADRTARRAAVPASGGTPAPRAVGKLFFSDDGSDFVCSATAIRSPAGNQVLTAGHCVHTGPNPSGSPLPILGGLFARPHYFENWVFVPRYRNGAAPLGRWVADQVHVSAGWVEGEDFAQDQAVLEVAPRRGRSLRAVVGGVRLAVGLGPRQRTRVWGWPAETPYDGRSAWRCDGPARPISGAGAAGDATLDCDMTGGASGGPWLVQRTVTVKTRANGRGSRAKRRTVTRTHVWAVTSRRLLDRPQLLAHPLTSSTRRLVRAAAR